MNTPRFEIGQKVRVIHRHVGTWSGKVLHRSLACDEWEYEVSNAPEIITGFPILAWEHELYEIK